MPQIVSVKVRHFRIPLAEVLVDAKHGSHSHFELITATIQLNDGSEGTGYTYTGGVGGHAIAAMIENDLTPFLIGKNAEDVEGLYDAMQWHVHYVARGGIASFAISAIDIALWDIAAKRANMPGVYCRYGYGDEEDLDPEFSGHSIDSITELSQILDHRT